MRAPSEITTVAVALWASDRRITVVQATRWWLGQLDRREMRVPAIRPYVRMARNGVLVLRARGWRAGRWRAGGPPPRPSTVRGDVAVLKWVFYDERRSANEAKEIVRELAANVQERAFFLTPAKRRAKAAINALIEIGWGPPLKRKRKSPRTAV